MSRLDCGGKGGRPRRAAATITLLTLVAGSLGQVAAAAAEEGRDLARDLARDMPMVLGGFEPEITITRGAEHFANVEPDADVDETQARLEGLLSEVGADVEAMTSGYAIASQEDFFAFVVALRVEGVEPGSLLPAYLPILYEDLVDPSGIVGRVGDKDVVIIASVGNEDEYVPLYVYDEGDTIWMVQGPEDVVNATLEGLPSPIEPAERAERAERAEPAG